MTDEITLPVEVPVLTTTTENVAIQVKELTLFAGDAQTPASITVVLGAKDGAGLWRADVSPAPIKRSGEAALALQEELIDLGAALPVAVAAMQEVQ